MNKKELRRKIIGLRDRLSGAEIEEKSRLIAANLYSLPEYSGAETVMFFITFGTEVNTRPMVEETILRGKTVLAPKALPKTRELLPAEIEDWESDLAPGAYNIPEPVEDRLRPVEPHTIDLLMVPGVAFDLEGNRLGYGGGYYDRFFNLLRKDTPLVALVFDLQLVGAVPVEKWDRRVDLIVTEKRVIDCRS